MEELKNTKKSITDEEFLDICSKVPCPLDCIKNLLTIEQKDLIVELFTEGIVGIRFNEDNPKNEYKEMDLTILGELRLFKLTNTEIINNFMNSLQENGYNINHEILDEFLIRSYLLSSVENEITVENLENRFLKFNNSIKGK